MTTTQTFTTPPGRLVGGSVFQSHDKGFDGQPLTTRGGDPRVEYVLVVAFRKDNPDTEAMRGLIYTVAAGAFPTLFPNNQCVMPTFSFKWTDGDSNVPNQRGNKPCDKEGYPGHWVLTFKSSFAPSAFGQALEPLVADQKAIKRGDYVRVEVSCKGNGNQQKPGVYLNHMKVQLCGYGEEISSGTDAATAFGSTYALPAGASATPMAPVGGMPGQAPVPGAAPAGMPAPAPGAAPAAAPAGMPAPAPGQAPAPSPGFGAAPPPPSAAPPAPPPPTTKQTVPGCEHTYESLSAGGWTEDQMRAAEFLA
jgi:hypothetical protein